MEKTLDRYSLAQVVIKDAINGEAEIYIDGHRVTGVIGYKIEQDAGANRVPLLTMQVNCQLNLDCGARRRFRILPMFGTFLASLSKPDRGA